MAGGPMKKECLDQLSELMGRKVSEQEGRDFRNEVWYYWRTTKSEKPELSESEAIAEVTRLMKERRRAQAQRIRENAYRRIIKSDEIQRQFDNFTAQGSRGVTAAGRVLEAIYTRIQATKDYYGRMLFGKMDALSGKWMGLIDDAEVAREFIRILHGHKSDNVKLKELAQAWRECSEAMRQAFNSLGGDIGRLDSWVIPQSHGIERIRNAAALVGGGKSSDLATNRKAWIDFVIPRLDRRKMLRDDGVPMSDFELRQYLAETYEEILKGQYNPEISLFAQRRAKANTRNEHRELFFKQDDDSWFEYFEMFSDNRSLSSVMMRHVSSMSRDIALLDTMGPNPEHMAIGLKRMAENDAAELKAAGGKDANSRFGLSFDQLWNTLNGQANDITHAPFANTMQSIRSLNVASKLGQAVIASFTDLATFIATTRIHDMDWYKSLKLLLTTDKEMAARLGVIADSFISDNCRFAVDNVGSQWASKLSEFSMKATILTGYTDQVRRSFAVAMLGHLHDLKGYAWEDLPAFTKLQMEKAGIGKKDWEVLQLLPSHEHGGSNFLSLTDFDNLTDEQLIGLGLNRVELRSTAFKFGTFIRSETYFASIQPDLATRAITTGGGAPKGSLPGELARNLLLFKSFPIAMMTKQMERLTDIRAAGRRDPRLAKWGRAKYFAYLVASSTVMGLIANQCKAVLAGKDLEDPLAWETWIRALSTGGALSFMYDAAAGIMEKTEYGHQDAVGWLGPVAGTAMDVQEFFRGLWDYMTDEENGDKHLASGIRALKRNLPIVNFWYVRGAVDRMVMHQIYDMLNPGYLERMEERMRKRTGQGYWWSPSDAGSARGIGIAEYPKEE